MKREDIISILKAYFNRISKRYNIIFASLYGSWACGLQRKDSDIDIAIMLKEHRDDDEVFKIITDISVDLTDLLKKEVEVLYIDHEFSRPLLYYNAIIKGIPLYIMDAGLYIHLRLRAITQMEDFNVFGSKWQEEIVRRRLRVVGNA